MPPKAYDPDSSDSMFTEILGRLDQQDQSAREFRQEMKDSFRDMNTSIGGHEERVRSLEKSAWKQRGAVGLIAFAIPLAWEYITSKH